MDIIFYRSLVIYFTNHKKIVQCINTPSAWIPVLDARSLQMFTVAWRRSITIICRLDYRTHPGFFSDFVYFEYELESLLQITHITTWSCYDMYRNRACTDKISTLCAWSGRTWYIKSCAEFTRTPTEAGRFSAGRFWHTLKWPDCCSKSSCFCTATPVNSAQPPLTPRLYLKEFLILDYLNWTVL